MASAAGRVSYPSAYHRRFVSLMVMVVGNLSGLCGCAGVETLVLAVNGLPGLNADVCCHRCADGVYGSQQRPRQRHGPGTS